MHLSIEGAARTFQVGTGAASVTVTREPAQKWVGFYFDLWAAAD